MPDHVYKTIELVGSSTKGMEDAVQKAIAKAAKSLPDGISLKGWRYSPDAWRIARRVDIRYVDALFRARSAAVLPMETRNRFIEMGIPAEVVQETRDLELVAIALAHVEGHEARVTLLQQIQCVLFRGGACALGQLRQCLAFD